MARHYCEGKEEHLYVFTSSVPKTPIMFSKNGFPDLSMQRQQTTFVVWKIDCARRALCICHFLKTVSPVQYIRKGCHSRLPQPRGSRLSSNVVWGEKWKVEALCAQELREQARFSAFCKGNRCAAQQAWGHFLPRALAQMEQYIKECVLISAQVQTELELSLLIFCSGKLCWVL